MPVHTVPVFTVLNAAAAVGIACLFIILSSLLRPPVKQKYMAILIAGAGAVYLSGGLGGFEFAFCGIMSIIAYKGLASYNAIGAGWLLHTGWDVAHHLFGNPILPFSPSSSAGCAVCDAILAVWFFCQAPNVFNLFTHTKKITSIKA